MPNNDDDVEDEGVLDDAVPSRGYGLVSVVGIGCAWVGREDLAVFLQTLVPTGELAVAVAFRPSNTDPAAIGTWLARATSLPVEIVDSRVRVEPDTVYTATPGKLLLSRGRYLDAVASEGPRNALPVDQLFRSLADAHGPHAVAVVLRGEGDDGSIGIRRIKERGGLTVVCERSEGAASEMVEAAIATGMIDWVLPADDIAPRIAAYCRMEAGIRLPPEDGAQLAADAQDETSFRKVLEFVQRRTQRDFRNYKRATVLRRLGRRMQVNGVGTLDAYLECIRTQPGEANALLQDMLVSVTNFFRDPQCFTALEENIPDLFLQKLPGDAVRVWVMACATGEEAYSIAMLMSEHVQAAGATTMVQVFASDLDEEAIKVAREGLYPFAIEADVSPERLKKFFVRESGGYRVKRALRELVLFAAHDSLRDPPFSRIDLASCRNLLIYLSRDAQAKVLETLHFALRPSGRLFLGASEMVDERNVMFSALDKKHRIYVPRPGPVVPPSDRRFESPPAVGARRVPVAGTGSAINPLQPVPLAVAQRSGIGGVTWAEMHLRAIDRLAPPSVLLDAQQGMLHISSAASRYLQFSGGEPTRNILQSVVPELKAALQSALFHAADEHQVVHTQPLRLTGGSTDEAVVITVQPLEEPEGGFLVMFRTGSSPLALALPLPGLALPAAEESPLVRQMEREGARLRALLRETVEQYEVSVEELKASNEELQAINEELHSATEELETGREELQSINEEHITVNQELKAKVEDLGQSNSDMQNLMDATAIPTVFLDRDFNLTRFTPSTVGLFKLLAGDTGRPLTDLTTPLHYPQLVEDARRVLQTLLPSEREVGDSQGNWYLARTRPYRTLEDRIAGVVLSFVDVTERKRVQESLRQTQERFSAIVNQASVGVAQTRLDGTLTFSNTSYQKLMGYDEQELVGRSALSLVHADDRAAIESLFGRLAATGEPFQSESRGLRKDGSVIWLHKSVTVLTDAAGKPDSALIVCTDMSERKFAEDALRDSEERLRLMLENAVDYAIFSLDLQRRVTSWNTGAQRLLGYSEEEILGLVADIIFTPEDRLAGAPDEEETVARREGRAADDRLHMRKDGSKFWASGAMMPMHNAQGTTIGLVKVLRDQSEQRAADQELQRSRSELIAALEANESARQALEAADTAKDQFLAVLSHELRNPLSSIAAASEILAPERLSVPELAHAAKIVGRQAGVMKVLLGDLLDVSSLQRGKLLLRMAPVLARTIVEAAVESTSQLMERGRHRLDVDICAEDLTIDGDAIRLAQVISNLLANAAKYTPSGGRIALTVRREGDDAVFEVSDNGIGMEPATVSAMFEMFTQGAQGHDRSAGGLGIGLALVRNIVELHAGSVRGESEGTGRGSRFRVQLPVTTAAAQPTEAPPEPHEQATAPAPASTSMKLLLADDNEDALWGMARMLSMAGYEVRTAANGEEAVRVAREFRPEAAVLDIGMPGLNGYDVARRLRADEGSGRIFLIAATGWGQPDDKLAAVEAGFDHHLIKPVAASEVRRVLAAWRAGTEPGKTPL